MNLHQLRKLVIINHGEMTFRVFGGKFGSPMFIAFARRLLKQAKTEVYWIVDGYLNT